MTFSLSNYGWECADAPSWNPTCSGVALLISQSGAVNSSTFIDSAKNHTITSSAAVWTNEVTLFGKPVILRTNGFLKITDVADLNIEAGQPFCIEMYYRNKTNSSANVLFNRGLDNGSDSNSSVFSSWSHSNGNWYGGNASVVSGDCPLAVDSSWHHLAITRDYLYRQRRFKDGVLVFGPSAASSQAASSSQPLLIGSTTVGSNYFAEIRFIIGSPVYTANFTPPSTPWIP